MLKVVVAMEPSPERLVCMAVVEELVGWTAAAAILAARVVRVL